MDITTLRHEKKIFLAGHRGMVGSAIYRSLVERGYSQNRILTRSRLELDLTNQASVRRFFESERPDVVYLAAAKVGGIYANDTYPADFIYNNLIIELNVINETFLCGVKELLFLGSSCIYPRMSPQPISEEFLLTGSLEPTNEPYAIAKIAGIKICESYNRQYSVSHKIDYRSIMPTNLYGPGDSYHANNSHVIPALIHRFHEAKKQKTQCVTIWGSGNQRREFLYVNDLAEACLHIMSLDKAIYDRYTKSQQSHINVGVGVDISIRELAELVSKTVGFTGQIVFDPSRPDGVPRKYLDNRILSELGWTPKTDLNTGLAMTYEDYLRKQ